MAAIEAAIKKLEGKHLEHIAVYGEDNEQRLSGKHEVRGESFLPSFHPSYPHASETPSAYLPMLNRNFSLTEWIIYRLSTSAPSRGASRTVVLRSVSLVMSPLRATATSKVSPFFRLPSVADRVKWRRPSC